MSHPTNQARLGWTDWLRLAVPVLLIAAFLIVAWKAGYFDLSDPKKLDAAAGKAQGIPWLGPVFAVAYAILAAFATPVSPLAYGAGAVFGLVEGSIWVWVGSMLGGPAGYWLARGAWADGAKRVLGRYHAKLSELQRSSAFLTTLRFQLMPIVPFGVFNYAAGATRLPFLPYVAGTAIAIIPGTIAAVYVGQEVVAGFRGRGKSAFLIATAVMLALIAVSFIPNLVKKWKQR